MALTYGNKRERVVDNKRVVEVDVIFDNSYPTGGELVSHTALGLRRIDRVEKTYVIHDGGAGAHTNHGWNIKPVLTDTGAVKLISYATTDTETANTTDMSGATERIRFIGNA